MIWIWIQIKARFFSYSPTKFHIKDTDNLEEKWRVKNDYKEQYRDFSKVLNKKLQPNDIVLKLDISNYFQNINHSKLISLLDEFSSKSNLKKHGYDNNSNTILEFYFRSLVGKKSSIPQGRRNFTSDYLGYLYLIPFDLMIEDLTQNKVFNFKSSVRYVDDIYIIFEMPNNSIKCKEIFKELLRIEGKIVNWFQQKLNLSVNHKKTERKIIDSDDTREKFIIHNQKNISSPNYLESNLNSKDKKDNEEDKEEIEEDFNKFKKVLKRFKFENKIEFDFKLTKEEKDDLKMIFNDNFQDFLFKPKNKEKIKNIIKNLDFELTTNCINILIVLFFLSKNDTSPFLEYFMEFLNERIDFSDKRHIHIVLTTLAQDIDYSQLKEVAKNQKEVLLNDNYGKYLAMFFNIEPELDNCKLISKEGIYKRIYNEYSTTKNYEENSYIFDLNTSQYIYLVNSIANELKDKEALLNQIKYYVHYKLNKKWDLSFNHFHGLFHEICKIQLDLEEKNPNLNKIINSLNKKSESWTEYITVKDELNIRKFFKRRNFNLISHPSQNGIASVKVTKKDLEKYVKKILPIIKKILEGPYYMPF